MVKFLVMALTPMILILLGILLRYLGYKLLRDLTRGLFSFLDETVEKCRASDICIKVYKLDVAK